MQLVACLRARFHGAGVKMCKVPCAKCLYVQTCVCLYLVENILRKKLHDTEHRSLFRRRSGNVAYMNNKVFTDFQLDLLNYRKVKKAVV